MRGERISPNLGHDHPSSADAADDRSRAERERQRRDFANAWMDAYREFNPSAQEQHLTLIAFLAAMARVHGLVFTSADAIYIAGYDALRRRQGRFLYSNECTRLRRAADRVWSALTLVQGDQPARPAAAPSGASGGLAHG